MRKQITTQINLPLSAIFLRPSSDHNRRSKDSRSLLHGLTIDLFVVDSRLFAYCEISDTLDAPAEDLV
jgi:hypothetical protein